MMVATIAAGTSAGYYLAQADYYLGTAEPKGRWIVATDRFGAVNGAEVDDALFERLHGGVREDGTSLLSNGSRLTDRVKGYDLTFSAPKSVSVVWALSDEGRRVAIEEVQAEAVRSALAMIERHACVSRRGRGGRHAEAVPMTAAVFPHGEARPAEHIDGQVSGDPQLHTHAVVLNLAPRVDGTVGTLDGRRLFAWKMAAGAVYHLALSNGLQRLGFDIIGIGKNGVFEVAGPSHDILEYFSARRAEVEAELRQVGVTSAAAPALAAAVTKTSRRVKTSRQNRDRHDQWRRQAAERGLDAEQVVAEAFSGRNAVRVTDAAEQLRGVLPAQLTQTQSVFERRELIAATAAALVGTGATVGDANRVADDLVHAGAIVELSADNVGEMRYSTPEMIRLERDILQLAQTLSARSLAAPDTLLRDQLVVERRLSAEQADAVSAATSSVALAVIEGAAGTGKTTSLRPIVEAHRAAGYRVIGSATAWRIASQLRDDLGIEARATESWLARAAAGQPFLDGQTLLIVDEAGQLSSRQMHAILAAVELAGAKIVLTGDRRQLQPIEAGGALSIVARAIDVARINRVVRQREDWARQATMALADGDVESALRAYADRGRVHMISGRRAAVAALVDIWEAADASSKPLVLARTNGDVFEINAEIRARLRDRSALHGPEFVIQAVGPSGHAQQLHLAVGDEVRFLSRNDELGVVNGTCASVTDVRQTETGDVGIHARVGSSDIHFTPKDIADESGRARLGHAYASTIYAAQGMTVDRALVLIDAASNRHDAYVALSRARVATDIFVDRLAIDAGLRADLPLTGRMNPTTPNDEVRLAWLSRRLSRSAAKGTTLDLLPTTDGVQSLQERGKQGGVRKKQVELER
jgi:conjugative relaxase-like TrwC/TraI family protein